MKTFGCLICALLVISSMRAAAHSGLLTQASRDARVYFLAPKDGAVVTGPVAVKFGLSGMDVAPAGVNVANTGHHHLLINLDALPNMTLPLPATEQIRHFGLGQTETLLTLPPGKHTLQLLMGNYIHVPHSRPVISDKITITVK